MMEDGGKGKANRADLVIVCDLHAYRRGHAHESEPCHILGGGPIPVSLAKELGRDAFLKAVFHTGTEIHTIAHFGRRYPAVLHTALDLGAPPDSTATSAPLRAATADTTSTGSHRPRRQRRADLLQQQSAACPPDHRIKTERDRKAGLLHGKRPRAPDTERAA